MTYNIDSIKIDLQTVGIDETPEIQQMVENELRRVMKFRHDIVAADIYLHEDGSDPTRNKVVRWRLGIPGKDLFAEAAENSWGAGLRAASEKLRRQIVD